jgi:hypothetical protein
MTSKEQPWAKGNKQGAAMGKEQQYNKNKSKAKKPKFYKLQTLQNKTKNQIELRITQNINHLRKFKRNKMLKNKRKQRFRIWMSINEYEQRGLKRELGYLL